MFWSADPKIANAIVRSSRRAYIIGVAVGQTNFFFFDAEGKQMAGFDIAVTRVSTASARRSSRSCRMSDIRVEGIGEGVILTGTVASQAEAQQAFDIAVRLVAASAIHRSRAAAATRSSTRSSSAAATRSCSR